MADFDEKVEQVMTIVNESIDEHGFTDVSVLFEKNDHEYVFIFYNKENGMEIGGYGAQKSFFEREDVSAEDFAVWIFHSLEGMVR